MYPGQQLSEVQKLRGKQIDSLRQFFPTVKEVAREQQYEIPIILPNRKTITLVMYLPPDFPRVPPVLRLSPTVQHPLVDSTMMILPSAHENLARWNVHVSLGKTVYEIVQKLMSNPPVPVNVGSNPIPSRSPIPPTGGGTSYPHFQPIPQQPIHQSVPPRGSSVDALRTPSSFPELESKSAAELSQLLNDETEFAKFFESLPAVVNAKKVREEVQKANEELGQKILAKEAEIERLKKENVARSAVTQEKRSAFEAKLQRQQEVMKQFSTPALIEKLGEKAQEADEASEELAKQFHSGAMDHKEFIKSYMEKRKLFHLRSAKKESLAMIAR